MAPTTEASANTSRAMADDSTISTVADPMETEKSANELERRRSIQQAIDEGHDADIPNSTGQMLPEVLESKRRRSSAANADIEKEAGLTGIAGAKGNETDAAAEDDPNVVFWYGPDDPENPYNWPTWRKITLCAIISFMTFITPLASCKSLAPLAVEPRGVVLYLTFPSHFCSRRARVDEGIPKSQHRACIFCGFRVHLRRESRPKQTICMKISSSDWLYLVRLRPSCHGSSF